MAVKETLEQENARLKKELALYDSKTTEVNSYLALRRYIDENNKLLMKLDIVSINKKDRDDKLAERAMKYSLEVADYLKSLKELKKDLSDTVILEAEKTYGNMLEEALEDDSEED